MDKKTKEPKPKAEPILFGGFDAVAEIANKLIANYHPHLVMANFLYCSRNKAQKQGGVAVAGTVKKASPLERHLGSFVLENDKEPDFIMIIALSWWNNATPSQRTAQIDHLLMQCMADDEDESGDVKYYKRPPEVQEFPEIVGRHGQWNDSLQNMAHELEK